MTKPPNRSPGASSDTSNVIESPVASQAPDLDRIRQAVRWNPKSKVGLCPAHADDPRKPNLSVSPGDKRPVVVHCFKGCSQDDVIAALVEMGHWPPTKHHRSQRTLISEESVPIHDENGVHVATLVRRDYSDREKSFVWQKPDGSLGLPEGLYAKDLLYGLEALAEMPDGAVVIICEGVRKAKALQEIGWAAVSILTGGGVEEPLSTHNARLLKRLDPHVWPDNDDTGRMCMRRVAQRLRYVGVKEVRLLDWKEAPPKGDAVDFIRAGGGLEDVWGLIYASEPFEPEERDRKLREAMAFLDEFLADGRRPEYVVRAAADAAGHKSRTLEAAKSKRHVVSEKEGFQGRSYWSLPKDANSSVAPKDANSSSPKGAKSVPPQSAPKSPKGRKLPDSKSADSSKGAKLSLLIRKEETTSLPRFSETDREGAKASTGIRKDSPSYEKIAAATLRSLNDWPDTTCQDCRNPKALTIGSADLGASYLCPDCRRARKGLLTLEPRPAPPAATAPRPAREPCRAGCGKDMPAGQSCFECATRIAMDPAEWDGFRRRREMA
jgi:hypothetical protein